MTERADEPLSITCPHGVAPDIECDECYPDCNCGWGGTHDPDNPRCVLNVIAADEPPSISERVPSVREVDGRLVIDWPDPRPRWFQITAEAFEALIARANHE
jgi:hypothetical protein